MSDQYTLRRLRELDRRLGQTEVKEVPAYSGFPAFFASGVWTPTYVGLSTAGVTTYTIQEGSYERVGRTIIAHGRVAWSAATGTGAAAISLPIAAVFTRVSRFVVSLYPVNVTFANGGIVGAIDSGTSTLAFVINSPATNAAGTILAVEAAGDLTFTAIYEAG